MFMRSCWTSGMRSASSHLSFDFQLQSARGRVNGISHMGSCTTAVKPAWAQMKANLGRISSSPDRRLERQREAELHFAGIAIARNPAKGSARLGGVHPEGVRVVEQIEGLGAELEAHLLGDPEILVNGEVHAPEARPIDNPTAGPSV